MKYYKCKIGDGFMYEDELSEDLPSELYDWWFNNSHVDGVRVGPIITTTSQQDNPEAEAFLNELMYHIHTSHIDMGGKHHYTLNPTAWPLVSKIKAWQASQLKM